MGSGLTTKKGQKLESRLITTKDELNVEFDSAAAFEAIVSKISVTVPDSLEGMHTPGEAIDIAKAALISSFKTLIQGMNDDKVVKHLVAYFTATSGLSKMINPVLMPKIEVH
jgi:hypothetical protein